ncbi:MAG: DUF975 family protein [Porcipelethomonas sp.]
MSTEEYRKKSKEILKGRYAEGFVVSFALIIVFLIFKAADLMLASAMVYLGGSSLSDLVAGGGVMGAVFSAVRHVLCFVFMVPLLTGVFWWYWQTAGGEDNGNILKIYSGLRLNVRAAAVYAVMWITGFLSLIPCGLCWLGAWLSFSCACRSTEQEIMLFVCIQLIAAGFFLLGLIIRNAASVSAAPFLFIMHPDMGAFKAVRMSARLMKGRKGDFVKLMLSYLPAMLPVVTVPFVLPGAVMSAALFVSEEAESGRT